MVNPNEYQFPLSIWNLVIENIADSEHQEVKLCLGEDLIEQSEELRKEIETLLEILGDVQSLECSSNVCSPSPNKLPELPDARQNIKKEIISFVEGIREQAKLNGRDLTKVLQKHDKDLIDYAYESGSSRPSTSDGSRPSTSYSSNMRMTPLSSSRSGSMTSRDDVQSMREKLNYLEFDDVKQRLQQHLQEEVSQLQEDLEDIQCSICGGDSDSKSLLSDLSTPRVPTLSELKEERSKLEQTLRESCKPVHAMPDVKSLQQRGSNKRLPGPIKASHTFIPGQSEKANHPDASGDCHITSQPTPTRSPNHKARHQSPSPTPTNKNTQNGTRHRIGGQNSSTSPSLATSPSPSSGSSNSAGIYPSPPSTFRPTSAQRFRNMILSSRASSVEDNK